jgi:hypothetical protein
VLFKQHPSIPSSMVQHCSLKVSDLFSGHARCEVQGLLRYSLVLLSVRVTSASLSLLRLPLVVDQTNFVKHV